MLAAIDFGDVVGSFWGGILAGIILTLLAKPLLKWAKRKIRGR